MAVRRGRLINVLKRKLTSSNADSFRRILKIRWQKRNTNKDVLKMVEIENLGEDVQRRRWKFIGHIMRKELQNNCRTVLTLRPREAAKKGKIKDNMERDGGERKGKNGMEELE